VNVSLDPETVRALDEITATLIAEFGFLPTRSQTLRYVLKDYATYAKMKAMEDNG
jgi:hypothetical protein